MTAPTVSRTRVLIYSASLGGVRRHIADIVDHIDHEAFELIGAFPEETLEHRYLPDESHGYTAMFRNAGLQRFTVETPPRVQPTACAKAILELREVIQKTKPQVLHCHSSMAGAIGRLAAALVTRPPTVLYTPHLLYFLRLRGAKRLVYLSAERTLLRLCEHLIAVSPSEYRESMRALGFSSRIVCIQNSVPTDLLQPQAAPEGHPAQPDAPSQTTTILSIARFDSQKDIPTLIRAVARLARARSDFRLLLAGDGEGRAETERHVVQEHLEQHVRFLGWRTDVRQLITESDFVVLSSKMEGLPYALLEAMSLEKPVIGSNVLGISDCIEHGKSGFLFPCGDERALAHFLEILIRDRELRLRMGAQGKLSIAEKFPPTQMHKSLQTLYEQCARRHDLQHAPSRTNNASPPKTFNTFVNRCNGDSRSTP